MDPQTVVARYFTELWNERAFALAPALIAPQCVTHRFRSAPDADPPVTRGPAALVAAVGSWVDAFPDLTVEVEASVIEGQRVVSWVAIRGTHRGAWLGVPPTGRAVVIRCAVLHRVQDERIVEDWVLTDGLGVLQQLGLVAPTAAILAAA